MIAQQVFDNAVGHLNFIAILDNYIIPALAGQGEQEEAGSPAAVDLTAYDGRYFSENRDEFIDVESDGDKLILTSSNGERNEFYPIAEQTFTARILDLIDVRVNFTLDDSGMATTLQSKFGYRDLRFTKI